MDMYKNNRIDGSLFDYSFIEDASKRMMLESCIKRLEEEIKELNHDFDNTYIQDVDVQFKTNYEIDEYLEEITFIEREMLRKRRVLANLKNFAETLNRE